jgi:hypothetical protein
MFPNMGHPCGPGGRRRLAAEIFLRRLRRKRNIGKDKSRKIIRDAMVFS